MDLGPPDKAGGPKFEVETFKPATDQRKANTRTALAFASIAVVLFVGVIVAHALGGPVIGVGVVAAAVLVFLVFAIGRNLRR